jgi:hypothetical protein
LLSSSLVLQADEKPVLDARGRPAKDAKGIDLPPVWSPTRLHSSDVVAVGDAVGDLVGGGLSVDALPDGIVWQGARMLDRFFAGQPEAVVRARCTEFLARYLRSRFPMP